MSKKAQQYWMDHELYRFVKSVSSFDISGGYYQNKKAIIGTVEHNGWKFSVVNNGTIKYVTPTGEKGYFIDC